MKVAEKIADHFPRRASEFCVSRFLICLYVFVQVRADARTAIEVTNERGEIEYVEQGSRKIGRDYGVGQLGHRAERIRH